MNCALWSAEVFEDDDGSLKNVHMAVLRGKQLVNQETITSSRFIFTIYLFIYNLPIYFSFSAVKNVKSQGPQLDAV